VASREPSPALQSQIISNLPLDFFCGDGCVPEAALTLGWMAPAICLQCGEWSVSLKPRDQDKETVCYNKLVCSAGN
jgi:hypothetical protein